MSFFLLEKVRGFMILHTNARALARTMRTMRTRVKKEDDLSTILSFYNASLM